jgi:hypothetical protein
MTTQKTWWIGAIGNERVVLTTDPDHIDEGERLNELELKALMWRWLAKSYTRAQLAAVYAELSGAPEPPTKWPPHKLETIVGPFLEHACSTGWLVALRNPRFRGAGGGGGPGPSPQPPEPVDPERPSPATFVEVELVDQTGRPIANERYRVTLPDGTKRTGRLDKNGIARIEDIRPAGACDIEFPDIHEGEWHTT